MERQENEGQTNTDLPVIDGAYDDARAIGQIVAEIMDRFGGDAANAEAAVGLPLPKVATQGINGAGIGERSASPARARFGCARDIHAALLCGARGLAGNSPHQAIGFRSL